MSHAVTHVSLRPVTCEKQRMLFGCNKEFLFQHEKDLETIFVKKRYHNPARLYAFSQFQYFLSYLVSFCEGAAE